MGAVTCRAVPEAIGAATPKAPWADGRAAERATSLRAQSPPDVAPRMGRSADDAAQKEAVSAFDSLEFGDLAAVGTQAPVDDPHRLAEARFRLVEGRHIRACGDHGALLQNPVVVPARVGHDLVKADEEVAHGSGTRSQSTSQTSAGVSAAAATARASACPLPIVRYL